MNYADLAANNMGKRVDIKGVVFTVTDVLPKTGKLKSGDEANYIELKNEAGEAVELHPRKAQALFTKGEAEGIRLLVDTVATEAAAPAAGAAPTETPAEAKNEGGAEAEAKPAKVSKKSQCVAAYTEGTAAGKTRKEILEVFATFGVTGPGAATYYQNCKSGAWK